MNLVGGRDGLKVGELGGEWRGALLGSSSPTWPGCWRGELLDLVLEGGAPLPHVCTSPGSWGAPLAPYLSQSGSDI